LIDTSFWFAPGDVVVLAGSTRNNEGTTTTGLPGTNGALAPVAPLSVALMQSITPYRKPSSLWHEQ